MRDVYLSGASYYLPGKPMNNQQIESLFELDSEWIEHFVGTQSRYLAFDFERWQASENLSQMATNAAQWAIAKSSANKPQIEFIVLSTATPDQLMPATVNQIADALDLNRISTYQIQCGCAGALQAIHLGSLLIQSGAFNCGLVIGADSCAKFIRSKEECANLSASELINYALFGDGAGAALISSSPFDFAHRLNACFVRFEGKSIAAGQEVNWFGAQSMHESGQFLLKEDYKAIQARVPSMTARALDELMSQLDWTSSNVKHYLLPQLSKNMSTFIREFVGVCADQAIQPVDTTGNNGNALPFIQLAWLESQIASGDQTLAVAIESSKWLTGAMALTRV